MTHIKNRASLIRRFFDDTDMYKLLVILSAIWKIWIVAFLSIELKVQEWMVTFSCNQWCIDCGSDFTGTFRFSVKSISNETVLNISQNFLMTEGSAWVDYGGK